MWRLTEEELPICGENILFVLDDIIYSGYLSNTGCFFEHNNVCQGLAKVPDKYNNQFPWLTVSDFKVCNYWLYTKFDIELPTKTND